MANRTAKYANPVHGTNPQYLVEKIIRTRIYDCNYWKEHCTLITSAIVLERAVDDLRFVGGIYGGNIKPTPFLCLVLKLLQIQPSKEIIYLFIEQSDFKYLRALGVFYLRLVGSPIEIYTRLEPLLIDYRKLRLVDRSHKFTVIHMDEYIEKLLNDDRVFDIILPRLTKRYALMENGDIQPYRSKLEDEDLIPAGLVEKRAIETAAAWQDETIGSSSIRGNADLDHRQPTTDSNYEKSIDQHLSDKDNKQSRQEHRDRYERDPDRRRRDEPKSKHWDSDDDLDDFINDDNEPSHEESQSVTRNVETRQVTTKYDHNQQQDNRSARSATYYRLNNKGASKISQQEIDEENSIRAKVGLKPLR